MNICHNKCEDYPHTLSGQVDQWQCKQCGEIIHCYITAIKQHLEQHGDFAPYRSTLNAYFLSSSELS